MAHVNYLTARRIGTGSQDWDLTMVLTCMFTYSAGFVFFFVLLALFPLTNHCDTCCYFRLVILQFFAQLRESPLHTLTNFIYLGFLLLLHSSFPEPFAEPNPKCMKSVRLGPS